MSTKTSSKAKKAKAKKGIKPENGAAVDQTQVTTPTEEELVEELMAVETQADAASIETPAPRRPSQRRRPRR